MRGDHLAGAAPGGEEVHHHQLAAGRLELGVEVGQVLDRVNHLESGYGGLNESERISTSYTSTPSIIQL